ncbi:MAG: hypothetical protein U0169_15850 [Polyangiaceae bacterium]
MKIRWTWALASMLGAVSACGNSGTGGGSDAGVPSPGAGEATRLAGVWAGPDGETGVADLTLTNPTSGTTTKTIVGGAVVTGTLRLSTVVGDIALSGEVDTTGSVVTIRGTASGALGAFTCPSGRLVGGRLSMVCTGADGVPRLWDSAVLGVDPIERYCGVMEGGLTGAFNLFTTGSSAGAVFWSGALRGAAGGTKSGSAITLAVTGGAGSANLTLGPTGTDLTGVFDVPGLGSGTVRGSKGACPGGNGVLPGDDAGSDATTVDASPQDAGRDSGVDATTTDAGRDSGSDAAASDAGRDSGSTTDSGSSSDAGRESGTSDAGTSSDGGSAEGGGSDGGAGGTTCANGRIVDLEANDYVSYLAVTDGAVFFVKNGVEMWRAPVDGRSAPILFATASANTGFWGVEAENGTVCWLEGSSNPQVLGGLRCQPAAGGNPISVVDNLVTPEGLTFRDGRLYWFSRTGRQIFAANAVASSAFALKYNMATDLPAPTQTTSITHLASDGEKIFFVADDYQAFEGRVYSIPEGAISTGTANPVQATDVSGPGFRIGDLASDGRYTFWLRAPSSPYVGALAVFDRQGVNTGMIDDYVPSAGALVAWPGEGLALFSYASGIARRAPGPGTTTTLVTGATAIAGDSFVRPIAADGRCVYWFGENVGRGVFAKPR